VSVDAWKQERQEGLERRTAAAQGLVGKTIAAAEVQPHDPECDAENVLVLTMTDGTVWHIEGGYSGYTGHSCDEYFEWVSVKPAPSTRPPTRAVHPEGSGYRQRIGGPTVADLPNPGYDAWEMADQTSSAIPNKVDRALPGPRFVLCAALQRRREADALHIAAVKRGFQNGSPKDGS
jgi:hypothetical protein